MIRPRWADALAQRERLSEVDRKLVRLLARLPWLSADLAAPLLGCSEGYTRRRLAGLRGAGLVGSLRPTLQPPDATALHYLTNLGLAVLALELALDVRDLARRLRLDRHGLLARAPDLRHRLAAYELLAAVTASRPGPPTLLAWLQPWRGQLRVPGVRGSARVQVPAYAALACDEGCAEVWLVPDLATFPLAVYRRLVDRLLLWSRVRRVTPTLVVATPTPARAHLWQTSLAEARACRHARPLPTLVTTWDELAEDPAVLRDLPLRPPADAAGLTQWIQGQPLDLPAPSHRVCILVGDRLVEQAPRSARARLGRLALTLAPQDYALLDVVAHHPFLTAEDLALLMGWVSRWTRQRIARLERRGLLRKLTAAEVAEEQAARGLLEATHDGLALVASRRGLPLSSALAIEGLVGGGPERPVRLRAKLVQILDHTLGVNRFFLNVYRTALYRRRRCHDDALVEWRNAAACATRVIRPDGYGAYRRDGRVFGFFLEYDRGTMKRRQYWRKFSAYHTYLERQGFERDYQGMPTILVVTTTERAEVCILQALRQVGTTRDARLPVLVTRQWRLDDPRRSDGMLAPIWRAADSDIDTSCLPWLPASSR